MSADSESPKSNVETTNTTNMSTNETSADDKLREKLKIYFNHTDFKSNLQREAITTILKREYEFTVKFKLF